MRVVVHADMEGVSQITDHRECWPVYPEYWRTGRRKLTADAATAVAGLLEGGATAVVVYDGHGFEGWPNLIPEGLPPRVELTEEWPADGGFDAVFQVGCHARCGTRHGFVSHTNVPALRVAVDGALVTESHLGAWAAGVPVLGIVGDAALGPELDGALAGTPFLAVKRAASRREAAPVHAGPGASAAAIREFAWECARRWREREAPRLPARFTVELSLDPAVASRLAGRHGLVRASPAVLRLEATDWQREARPAIGAASRAAAGPLLAALDGLDLSTEDALRRQAPERLEGARRAFADFVQDDYAAWRTE